MNLVLCPKTVTTQHHFVVNMYGYEACVYCDLVDDRKKIEKEPIKIKRNKKKEKEILG